VAGSLFCSRCGLDVSGVHGPDAPTLEVTAVGTPAPRVKATMRQTLRDATLGEYEILSELGRGGMATVFLAHDIALDRKVAIKVMAPHLLEGEGMAERFKLEARTAAQLSHPHIIPIYAVKETESTLYFVMKYVEGRTLDEIIKRLGQLPIPMVKDILTKVGSALGYAHRRNVIHRDVKPGNIMIDEEGTPIVTDFGIAKVAEKKGLTMTGTTIGTPSYMSPEQCEAKVVTGASDQYSLGAVAWEMLTGRTPFAGDSAVTTMYKHCHEPLPPLQDFRPDSPGEVLETVTRMLAKAPSDRWPSLEAAIRKLNPTTESQLDPVRQQLLDLARDTGARELIAQLSTPRSPMPGLRTGGSSVPGIEVAEPAPARRSWFPVVAAVGILVAASGGALAVLQPWRSGPPPAATEGRGTASEPAATGSGIAAGGDASGSDAPSGVQGVAGGGGSTAGTGSAPAPAGGTTSQGGGSAAPTGAGASTAPSTSQPTTQPRPAATVASVRIGGARSGLEPGNQLVLSATALDASGGALSGGAVRWTSSDESVGRVTSDGSFTALAPGSVMVTASVGGASGSTTIDVGSASIASLSVEPASLSLTQGERAVLAAAARGRDQRPVDAGTVTWRSDAPGVASVSASGEVQAVGPGSATITASAGGTSTAVRVSVAAPVIPTRTAIEELVAAYALALESRDINAVRRVYPGMTQQQERDLSAALPSMQAANLRVESLQEQGDEATARVAGEYVFLDGGRQQRAPVQFTATFQRDGTAWRMTRTQ
jgi:serine/threonine-protein kinase